MKTSKRVKGWLNEWRGVHGILLCSKRPKAPKKGEPFRAVRVVELRKGEVIVDVEALVEAYLAEIDVEDESMNMTECLCAALRKVGKR